MTHAIYLLGGPGVGKSTIMGALLDGWATGPYERLTSREMFGHALLGPDLELGMYLGRRREEYPGTDALSLSVAPQALLWLESMSDRLDWVFGEGVRLGHLGFLEALAARTELTVVHLTVDPEIAAARRDARPGKKLSEKYAAQGIGRARSAAAACTAAGLHVVAYDTSDSVEDVASAIWQDALPFL